MYFYSISIFLFPTTDRQTEREEINIVVRQEEGKRVPSVFVTLKRNKPCLDLAGDIKNESPRELKFQRCFDQWISTGLFWKKLMFPSMFISLLTNTAFVLILFEHNSNFTICYCKSCFSTIAIHVRIVRFLPDIWFSSLGNILSLERTPPLLIVWVQIGI